MRRILLTLAINVAAIFVASIFVDGIDYASKFWVLIVAGAVFGIVNLLLKPIVRLLALPLAVVTLGLAFFAVNLLMLYVTSWIVGPFSIGSFMDAVWATVIIWVVNVVLGSIFGLEDRRRKRSSDRD
jgi:putative membrane protein